MNVTCSGAQTPSTSRRSSTVATCAQRGDRVGSVEVGTRRSPSRPPRCRCRGRRRPRRRVSGRRPSAPGPAAAAAAPARVRPRRPSPRATPSTLAPAITSKCSSSPKCARIRCAVGSAFDVATASRTPAARRSASSAGMPSNSAVHRPAAGRCSPRGTRRSPRRRRSPRPMSRSVWCIGGPTTRPARSPSGTTAPI